MKRIPKLLREEGGLLLFSLIFWALRDGNLGRLHLSAQKRDRSSSSLGPVPSVIFQKREEGEEGEKQSLLFSSPTLSFFDR